MIYKYSFVNIWISCPLLAICRITPNMFLEILVTYLYRSPRYINFHHWNFKTNLIKKILSVDVYKLLLCKLNPHSRQSYCCLRPFYQKQCIYCMIYRYSMYGTLWACDFWPLSLLRRALSSVSMSGNSSREGQLWRNTYGSGFLFGRKHHSEGSPPSTSALRKVPFLPQTTVLFHGDHGHAFAFPISKPWFFCVIG